MELILVFKYLNMFFLLLYPVPSPLVFFSCDYPFVCHCPISPPSLFSFAVSLPLFPSHSVSLPLLSSLLFSSVSSPVLSSPVLHSPLLTESPTCTFQGFLINFADLSTTFWVCVIALHTVMYGIYNVRYRYFETIAHVTVWGAAFFFRCDFVVKDVLWLCGVWRCVKECQELCSDREPKGWSESEFRAGERKRN